MASLPLQYIIQIHSFSLSLSLSHRAEGNYLNIRRSAAGVARLIFNSRDGEIASLRWIKVVGNETL